MPGAPLSQSDASSRVEGNGKSVPAAISIVHEEISCLALRRTSLSGISCWRGFLTPDERATPSSTLLSRRQFSNVLFPSVIESSFTSGISRRSTGISCMKRVAVHSFSRTPGMAPPVILTLALGIGANAAIFTLVRGILLKPLVNRDEDRLIYIRQSAPGIRDDNATFSVPEIHDLRASVKTVSVFGDFSTIGFTMIGLGEP